MIQLNIVSSKSGRIYLKNDLRVFISRRSELEAGAGKAAAQVEVRQYDEMPRNPKYFARAQSKSATVGGDELSASNPVI